MILVVRCRHQEALALAVLNATSAARVPAVVVLVHGGALAIERIKAAAPAILGTNLATGGACLSLPLILACRVRVCPDANRCTLSWRSNRCVLNSQCEYASGYELTCYTHVTRDTSNGYC